jgi:small-conductance mechanosensitive channel
MEKVVGTLAAALGVAGLGLFLADKAIYTGG